MESGEMGGLESWGKQNGNLVRKRYTFVASFSLLHGHATIPQSLTTNKMRPQYLPMSIYARYFRSDIAIETQVADFVTARLARNVELVSSSQIESQSFSTEND